MTTEVTVTEEDWDTAQAKWDTRNSANYESICAYCPMALALKRATGRQWHVHDYEACEMSTMKRFSFPDGAQEIVNAFDTNRKPSFPATVCLDIPE